MRQLPPNTNAQGTEVNPGYVPPSGQATQQGQQPSNPAYGSPQYYDPNTPFDPNQPAAQGQGDAGVQKYEPPGVKQDSSAPTQFPGQIQTQKTVEQTSDAPGGVVRWLDKVSGDTVDLTIPKGQSKTEGRLTITLKDCRYPVDDPSSDAFAYLSISDKAVVNPIFQGWMIASSPAINALDSARYDVWVLRCTNEPGSTGSSAASNSASSSSASDNSN
ncbi:DUF2155 domain-containing protein [Thioclava sp. BHET1]|nr:DUF2155 domain-containing protein [Thioclava sp. BHET1]